MFSSKIFVNVSGSERFYTAQLRSTLIPHTNHHCLHQCRKIDKFAPLIFRKSNVMSKRFRKSENSSKINSNLGERRSGSGVNSLGGLCRGGRRLLGLSHSLVLLRDFGGFRHGGLGRFLDCSLLLKTISSFLPSSLNPFSPWKKWAWSTQSPFWRCSSSFCRSTKWRGWASWPTEKHSPIYSSFRVEEGRCRGCRKLWIKVKCASLQRASSSFVAKRSTHPNIYFLLSEIV